VKWSDEDKATIKRMVAEGFSASKIAAAMGRHRGSVCWHAQRYGLKLVGHIGIVRNAPCRKNPYFNG